MDNIRRQLRAKFHYVSEQIIELLPLSDISMFDEPYTCVYNNEDSEYTALGFKTKEQLEREIIGYHLEVENDGWSLDSIYKRGRKMKYEIEVKVKLI